jgi:acetyl esterase/lipase
MRHILVCVLALAILAQVRSSHAGEFKNVRYGPDPAQRMDIYAPDAAQAAPIILMVHGGAWRFGDKNSRGVVHNKVERWVPRGFVFVSINYRMLPSADVLQQAADVSRALAYAQQHANGWGASANKVILIGHSAGAHLVSLLTANPDLARKEGAQPWLGTISLDSAAIDVSAIMKRRHVPLYDEAFGTDPDFWKATSPMHVLTREALPLLAVCSSVRLDQPCKQARAYVRLAAQKGVRAELLEEPLSHPEVNEKLGLDNEYTKSVENFMSSLDPTVYERINR